MENKATKVQCDGKCITCGINQRTYCTAQILYYMHQEITEIKNMLIKKDDTENIINKEKTI